MALELKKIPNWLLWIFIGIPFVVDSALNIFGMTILVFDPLFKIAFGLIGLMNVIFVLISLAIDKKILYWLFVILVTFFDLSFSLEAVKQSELNNVTVETDSELNRLKLEETRINGRIDRLMTEHESMTKIENLRANEEQQRTENNNLTEIKSKYDKRFEKVERGEISKYRITANSVMMAIPDSIFDGKILTVVIFLWIFSLLQAMIFLSMKSFDFKEPETKKRNLENIVKQWVTLSWFNIRANRGTDLIPKKIFMEFAKERKIDITDSEYDQCLWAATVEKIVDSVAILCHDEREAIEKILRRLSGGNPRNITHDRNG